MLKRPSHTTAAGTPVSDDENGLTASSCGKSCLVLILALIAVGLGLEGCAPLASRGASAAATSLSVDRARVSSTATFVLRLVRYSTDAELAFVSVCHCTDRQKFSGSAFATDWMTGAG